MSDMSPYKDRYIDFLPQAEENDPEKDKVTHEAKELYDRYLREMNLKEGWLRNKSILDIGSEQSALFLNTLAARKVTEKEKVMGLDSKRYRMSFKDYAAEGTDAIEAPETISKRKYVEAKKNCFRLHTTNLILS